MPDLIRFTTCIIPWYLILPILLIRMYIEECRPMIIVLVQQWDYLNL